MYEALPGLLQATGLAGGFDWRGLPKAQKVYSFFIDRLVCFYIIDHAVNFFRRFFHEPARENPKDPGVRELHNFLDKYLFLGEDALKSLHFSEEDSFLMNLTGDGLSFKEATEEFEKQIIMKALSKSNGSTGLCAERLDMNLRTLQRKIKYYGIK